MNPTERFGVAPAGDAPVATGGVVATDLATPLSRRELAVIALAAAYLLGPWRDPWIDTPLFLLAAAVHLLFGFARPTAAVSDEARRRLHVAVASATALGVLSLVAAAWAFGVHVHLAQLLLLGLAYVPFAYLQQIVTQGYVVGRLGRWLAGGDELRAALIGGALFAAAHLPLPGLFWPTLAAGVLWGLAWQRGASLHALAFSHGLLGAAYFLCVLGRHPFGAMTLG